MAIMTSHAPVYDHRLTWQFTFVSALLLISSLFISDIAFGLETPTMEEPFQIGERLSFQIRWSFIPAAEATLEILSPPPNSSDDSLHFVMTARTYPVVDLLYKLRERVDSITDRMVSKTLSYTKVQSGKSRRDIKVSFDWQKQTACYSNFGEAIEPVSLPSGTMDPLSSLYYIRKQIIAPGQTIERPVTDGKKVVVGKVHFIGKETIKVNGTKYETLKLEPELEHVKGVFEKSKNAKMYIWVTNDPRKLLVRLTSKVVVGSFIADLIDYRKDLSEIVDAPESNN